MAPVLYPVRAPRVDIAPVFRNVGRSRFREARETAGWQG